MIATSSTWCAQITLASSQELGVTRILPPSSRSNTTTPCRLSARSRAFPWATLISMACERKLLIVLTDGPYTFDVQADHAWRHTVKQIGYRNEISDRLLDAIIGHSPPTP